MMSRAKARLGDSVTLVQGSGNAFPFEASSFDAVTIHQVIHHFPPADGFAYASTVFQEIYRVLKPGGVLVMSTSTPEQQRDAFWWMSLFPKAADDICSRF